VNDGDKFEKPQNIQQGIKHNLKTNSASFITRAERVYAANLKRVQAGLWKVCRQK